VVGITSPAPAPQPELTTNDALRSKRERLGLSKRELGRRAGLSAAYVSAFEAGKLRPSFIAFARLAVELRLTPAEIFLLVQSAALENRDAEDE
jgi:transcriptional regulator with XRE-family HTH domain